MVFSGRIELHQGAVAQEELNTGAHSGPAYNSDYIGRPSAHSEAQCKRPAQFPPIGRGYFVGRFSWRRLSYQAQPAMSLIGTKRTCRGGLTTSALEGTTDVSCKQGHFRV